MDKMRAGRADGKRSIFIDEISEMNINFITLQELQPMYIRKTLH